MVNLTRYQKKTLDIYHNDGHEKAWNYWSLTGHNCAIFLGEIPSNDFITGEELAKQIGITQGTSQYNDTPWLKFILDGNIIIVPMKSIMCNISWEHIYQAGAVYGTDDNGFNPSGGDRVQDARVTIYGYEFKVTSLKGANSDPTPNDAGYDIPLTHGSEWNRLMYPIHSGVHTDTNNPSNTSIAYNQWATYSDSDLLIHRNDGDSTYTWTQETQGFDNSFRLLRGAIGVTYAARRISTNTNSNFGWRPALRQITK